MSHRCDPRARELADRHYNRQSIGAQNFAPPGRALVLFSNSDQGKAFWITSWPFAEFVRHDWAGAWVCSAFRNESNLMASEMIRQAVAGTVAYYGSPPLKGLVTFLDTKKVKPTIRRGVKTWGYSWLKAGFVHVGYTKGGLMAFRLPLDRFPAAVQPRNFEGSHKDFRPFETLRRECLKLALVAA